MGAFIIGSGTSLPETVITNEEIAAPLGLESDQIFKSSGIRQRHWTKAGTTTSSLAAEALRLALADSGTAPEAIDYLIFGTMTPDRFIPGSAPAIQSAVGLGPIPCLDIRGACCNTLYGLQLARALIQSGAANTVALCLAEVQSAFLRLRPEAGSLSMLFGDGAAALIISADGTGPRAIEILDVLLETDGKYTDDLGLRSPGSEFGTVSTHAPDSFADDYAPRMNGQSVILQASRRMVAASRALLERNQLTVNDIQWVVPHQANANLLAQVARGLGLANRDGLVSVLAETGNTSSASMGIALDHLRRSDRLQPGDKLLLPAFAAGFTWGAALCRATSAG